MSAANVTTSAPGKLLLSGEYAVLDGAPAIVTAVQARVVVRLAPGEDGPEHPERAATRALAEARFGAVAGALEVDASATRAGAVKLGLGSSAAIAAAVAAAVAAARGHDPASVRDELLELALAGHRAVSPEGSGADVAASVLGGLIRFQRVGGAVDVRPLSWSYGLEARVVWTGHAARTSDFIAKVRALALRSPALHSARMEALAHGAAALADAFEAGDARAVVAMAGEYGEAMGALGEAAEAPIVEARLSAIDALAGRFGGRAKPSGAGGGDVAVAFFADSSAAAGFDDACLSEGLHTVVQPLGGEGARAD